MEPTAGADRIVRSYQVAAQIIGWFTLGVGFTVLVMGWWLDFAVVRSLLPGTVSMKANAAVAFIFIGISLISYLRSWPTLVALVSAGLCFVIGVVTCVEYALGVGVTVFDSLLGASPDEVLTPSAGRPALVAAICFVLIGVALVLLITRRWCWVRQGLGAIVIVSASVILLAYIGLDRLADFGRF